MLVWYSFIPHLTSHSSTFVGRMSKPVFDLPDTAPETGDPPPTEDTTIRARFTNSLVPLKPALVLRPLTLPLLSSTPPTVAKALTTAYPYLVVVNKLLAIATWTNEDLWVNVFVVAVYTVLVLYFEQLVVWLGHIILVVILMLYAVLNDKIAAHIGQQPTLDEVVQQLTLTCIKADMLLAPITQLSLSIQDIKRLLFTTVFLTPVYLILTTFVINPRIILLVTGWLLLTYNLASLRVFRRMLWRFKLTRIIVFYVTGLDFSLAKNKLIFQAAMAKMHKSTFDTGGKPVRFTYVIYENQRKWLGIGWTSNLLTYERTPWTDEFLNELASTEEFKLPEPTDDTPYTLAFALARWRWVDKTWRLDLTNDGAIQLPSLKRSKTTANPSPDEGYVYSDNTWKKPLTDDTFSKYTRRRRWIRTAELLFDDESGTLLAVDNKEELKKRKLLRFDDE